MRIAVCENRQEAAEQLRGWIAQYCALYHIQAVIQCFLTPEEFAGREAPFDIVFMGFGGSTGFFQARLLREQDGKCRIIFVDDTQEYTVRCVRIHCTDFILRPVEFPKVVRSMHLGLGGGFK